VATTISNTPEKINIKDLIVPQYPLASLCTYQTGGKADFLAMPANLEQLRTLLEYSRSNQLPITILGGGSNVLISDEGVPGLVILTKKLCSYHVRGTLFCARSGLSLETAINASIESSLSGLETLGGLPGTIG